MNSTTLSTTSKYRRVQGERTVIFEEGQPGGSAFVIESGSVLVYRERDGIEVELARLGPGDLFGEVALLDGGVRTASVCVLSDTLLFEIEPTMMRRHIDSADPVVGMVLNILVGRVRSALGPGGYLRTETAPRQTSASLVDQMRLEREIARAIRLEHFVAALQPIVSLADGKVAGFEALARWQHAERGIVMPGDFIPIAESARLVGYIDWLCMKAACLTLRRVKEAFGAVADPWWVSVNLSGTHFAHAGTVDRIREILAETGLAPSSLKVEITETVLVSDIETAASVAKSLRDFGVRIALDDFGVGYASLAYLHRMPLDTLKIDRSFIDQVTANPQSEAIVRAMLGLGDSFSLTTVAEGVERPEQADLLRTLGCRYAQGWLFARPMLEAQLLPWLERVR
ncbi:MAG: EAL domain-containing protein [Deltaproteobacteria bacterium]